MKGKQGEIKKCVRQVSRCETNRLVSSSTALAAERGAVMSEERRKNERVKEQLLLEGTAALSILLRHLLGSRVD
jgi:hypothetical protein